MVGGAWEDCIIVEPGAVARAGGSGGGSNEGQAGVEACGR